MGFTCCICHEELYQKSNKGDTEKIERPTVATKCGHLYHNDCLKKWFMSQGAEVWTSRECPVCRMSITVATDLIRIFTSPSDEGGPSIDDLKSYIQKMEGDKSELVKRLELSFHQAREAQKVFDQFKRDNDKLSDMIRKLKFHQSNAQSENAKLKAENDDLKNMVVSLTKTNYLSGNSQPNFRSKFPVPQNGTYAPSSLPPRFRPQGNNAINVGQGKYTVNPLGPPSSGRQFPSSQLNGQSLQDSSISPSGISDETRNQISSLLANMNSKNCNNGQENSQDIYDQLNGLLANMMPPVSGSLSSTDPDSISEQESENVDSASTRADNEVAAALGFHNVISNNHLQTSTATISSTSKNITCNNTNGNISGDEDNSNYFPRMPNENNYYTNNSKILKNVKVAEGETNGYNNTRKAPSPTDEFLEALLNTNECERDQWLDENSTDHSNGTSEKRNNDTMRVLGRPQVMDAKTPYQGQKQCYGKYLCNKCNAKWGSSRSWANKPQICLYCKSPVFPYAQAPLLSKDELEEKKQILKQYD